MPLYVYMGPEEFEHTHERRQADDLYALLNKQYGKQVSNYYLCYNFMIGGKSLDGILIKKDVAIIFDFKLVGGIVNFGKNLENEIWTFLDRRTGKVLPVNPPDGAYPSPFSQLKSYRTACLSFLKERKKTFLNHNRTQNRSNFSLEQFVKTLVIFSSSDTKNKNPDENLTEHSISFGTKKWFQVTSLTNSCRAFGQFAGPHKLEPTEMKRLVENVFGLKQASISDDGHIMPAPVTMAPNTPATLPQVEEKLEEPVTQKIIKIKNETPQPTDVKTNSKTQNYDSNLNTKKLTLTPPPEVPQMRPIDTFKEKKLRTKIETALFYSKVDRTITPSLSSLADMSKQSLKAYQTIKQKMGKDGCDISDTYVYFGKTSNNTLISEEICTRIAKKTECLNTDTERVYFIVDEATRDFWWIFSTKTQTPIIIAATPPPPTSTPGMIDCIEIIPPYIKNFIKNNALCLSMLSVEKVQRTTHLDDNDINKYLKTYMPDSYRAGFSLMREIFKMNYFNKDQSNVSVLSLGCGPGCGDLLGILDCIRVKHRLSSGKLHFNITLLDLNDAVFPSCDQALNVLEEAHSDRIASASINCTTGDILTYDDRQTQYDVILSSKCIGEIALGTRNSNPFTKVIEKYFTLLNPNGILLLIDLPKHKDLMNKASIQAKNLSGTVETGILKISDNPNRISDNEFIFIKKEHENGKPTIR